MSYTFNFYDFAWMLYDATATTLLAFVEDPFRNVLSYPLNELQMSKRS